MRAAITRCLLIALVVAGPGAGLSSTPAMAQGNDCGQPLVAVGPFTLDAPPADGSERQRVELDQLLTLQATRTPDAVDAARSWLGRGAVAGWNDALLQIVRENKMNPVRASRSLALLNVAMHDAALAACVAWGESEVADPATLDTTLAPATDLGVPSSYPSAEAAVAAAARAVLGDLYPGWLPQLDKAFDQATRAPILAGTNLQSAVDAGEDLGGQVGALVAQRGRSDGSDRWWTGTVPTGPGMWMEVPSAAGGPVEPLAGTWRPWLMARGDGVRPGPPPAYRSPQWQADADELVRLTDTLTDDEVRIARFWADDAGTDTPAGHWARIAISEASEHGLGLMQTARLLGYVAMAEADAFIACWDAMYTYWSGGPVGLIEDYASTIISPNVPSYPSGHAVQSAAAAVVLGHFFADDAAKLMAMAEEAGMSRLYGGVQWRTDITVGLDMGKRIGRLAVERADADDTGA